MKRKSLLLLVPFAVAAMAGCTPVEKKDGGQCDSATVTLNKESLTLEKGETYQLEATISVEGCPVNWSTSAAGVATVSEDGLVTAVGKGTATISANGTAFCEVTVTEEVPVPDDPVHLGTEADPYDSADAACVASKLPQGDVTPNSFYIKDTVKKLEETFNPSYGNYSFNIGHDFICWRLKKGPNNELFNDGDIAVGDEVVVYAQIQKFHQSATEDKPERTLLETKGGYVVSVKKNTPVKEIESVDSIVQEGLPTQVVVGGSISSSLINLNVTYTTGEKGTVHPDKVEFDNTKAAENVVVSCIYGDFPAVTFTIKVVNEVTPEHAGTEADPYTGADAVLVASQLQTGEATAKEYYIKGVVQNFEEDFTPSFGNYSFAIEDGFIGWRLKKGPTGEKFQEGDLEVGDTVLMNAKIQKYTNGKPETKDGYIVKIEKGSQPIEPSLVLNKTSASIKKDAEVTISATVKNTTNPVAWSFVDEASSTVVSMALSADNKSVVVTALSVGTAKIKASIAADNLEAICTITVKEDVPGQGAVYTFSNDKTEAQNIAGWTDEQFMPHVVGEGADIITGLKSASNAYIGGNGGSGDATWNIWDCLKVGKSAKNGATGMGSVTLKLDSSVSFDSIKVSAIGARDDGTLTINGVTKTVDKKAEKGKLDPIELEYEIEGGISELTLTSKDATSNNYGICITCIEFVSSTPVDPEVVSVTVSPKTSDLPMNSTLTLTAKVETKGTASKEVDWSSSDDSIATVDANGLVTPVKEGTVTITATAKDDANKKDTATITVVPEAKDELQSIKASGYIDKALKDSSYEFDGIVTGHYSISGDVELKTGWTASTIDTSTTGDKKGTITYKDGDLELTCDFTVNVYENIPVEGTVVDFEEENSTSGTVENVTFSSAKGDGQSDPFYYAQEKELRLYAKNTFTVSAEGMTKIVFDYNGCYAPDPDPCKKATGDIASATVGTISNGVWTGSADTVTFTMADDGQVHIHKFIVSAKAPEPVVESVTVTPKSLNLIPEQKSELTATIVAKHEAPETLSWESSDTEVATVSNGVVTAVGVGEATITVRSTYDNSKFDTCAVKVTAEPVVVELTEIRATGYTTEVEQGDTYKFDGVVTAYYSDGTNKVLTADEYAITTNIDSSSIGSKNGVISYSEKTCNFTVTVTEASQRAPLPYNVSFGSSLSGGWEGNGETYCGLYGFKSNGKYAQVKGLFKAQKALKVTVYAVVNSGSQTQDKIKVYGLNDAGEAIEGAVATTEALPNGQNIGAGNVDKLAVGREVTIEGAGITGLKIEYIKASGSTVFRGVDVETATPQVVTGATIGGSMSKTSYSVGDNWKIDGLTFKLQTPDGEVDATADKFDISFNPAKAETVGENQTIVVTAVYKLDDKIVATKEINGITVKAEAQQFPISLEGVSGSSVSSAKITVNGVEETNAIKAGTGKVAGSADIVVPAGAKTFRFYIGGWKDETSEIEVTIGSTTKAYDIIPTSTISGNSFSLTTDDLSDYMIEIEFDEALAEDTTVTIAASVGYRYILWNPSYSK